MTCCARPVPHLGGARGPGRLKPALGVRCPPLPAAQVPSFDSRVAMQLVDEELGRPWQEVYSELRWVGWGVGGQWGIQGRVGALPGGLCVVPGAPSADPWAWVPTSPLPPPRAAAAGPCLRSPEPIAAASLGQVYKGVLRTTGETVAVKVQRPGVLETVTVDLYIIRSLGLFLRRFPAISAVRPAQGWSSAGAACRGSDAQRLATAAAAPRAPTQPLLAPPAAARGRGEPAGRVGGSLL